MANTVTHIINVSNCLKTNTRHLIKRVTQHDMNNMMPNVDTTQHVNLFTMLIGVHNKHVKYVYAQ